MTPQDRMTRLLDYVVEQAKDIDPTAFNLSHTVGFIKRPDDLRALPGVDFNLQEEGDHVWLSIARLEATKSPVPPAAIAEFVFAATDPFGAPPYLLERALAEHLEDREEAEEARLDVEHGVEEFARRWMVWAESEKPRRSTISLYGELFALSQQLVATETTAKPQELVWGVGITVWRMPCDGERITFDYPLLTQATEISIDAQSMRLTVRPRDVPARVEFDAIAACIPSSAEIEKKVRDYVHKVGGVSPFDPSTYTPVLKLAGSALDADGVYRELVAKGEPTPAAGNSIVVTDNWVLFSRPRSNNYLIEDIHRLKARVEEAQVLPAGPVALVSEPLSEVILREPVSFRGLGGSAGESGSGPLKELYFPLPYNEEQVSIIRRLESAPGVAVQGPPGTGKTHTIANVICHYLATGRRVLVTSKGEAALEVLQKMIPEEVRALTCSLLAGDREGIRQCQASISAIQHHISQLDERATKREIAELEQRIDRVHAELNQIDRGVDAIAAEQLDDIDVDGVIYRAQKLAELVVEGEERHAWFDDALTLTGEHAPPLSDSEAALLRDARRRLGHDLEYMGLRMPNAAELPTIDKMVHLHDGLLRLGQIEDELHASPAFALRSSTPEALGAVELFLKRVEDARRDVAELECEAPEWGMSLREKCRLTSFASERQALEALSHDIDTLTAERAAFLQRPVELPLELLTDAKAIAAVERGAESGKPFGLMAFAAGDAKARLAAVRVAGLPVTDADGWKHVARYLRLHTSVTTFLARWNAFAVELGLPTLTGGVDSLRRLEGIAHAARRALKLATNVEPALAKQGESLFVTAPTALLLGASENLGQLSAGVRPHLTKAQLAGAAVARSRLDERLAVYQGPVADRLRALAADHLGRTETTNTALSAEYAAILAEVHRVSALSSDLGVVADGAARIRHAGAERWSHRLLREPAPPLGEDAGVPSDWQKSWTWARMRGHLGSIEARSELRALAARRVELTAALEKLYRTMVARSAWLATKEKTTHSVLQALMAFATAIGKIGKATGPNASMYRRNAREAMDRAVGAVPCWIMSHARVSESAPAELGAFHLVIVDEASQSDLWALPAILRGTKILVVGDDKQVSPDGGFISAAMVSNLRERFLRDQPYANALTPGMSLYDLAAQVYAADQVMLREHFRCVSPIIAYSNKHFYQNAIQPLRIPKASERIDPPLVDIFVHGGVRDRHDCNPMEAQAIADEIGAILGNEKFAHCTLGVVSLLGMEQAKYIDEVVRSRFAVTELMRRKFECGDARTFQGSERDIMFLSMVADPGNHHALSGIRFDQRFNVAASRARDRMYLVRSVERDELSTLDLRQTLIEHFEKPMVADPSANENLAALCESGFEREVFGILIGKGYRVVPQVKVGSFRIDMVVEGAQDRRLAIELDGDDHHGPDRWKHDMTRQRILERAGWIFWRCFASTWSMSKESVIAELTQRLNAMGIEPIGALDRIPNLVERREYRNDPTQDAETEVANLIERASQNAP